MEKVSAWKYEFGEASVRARPHDSIKEERGEKEMGKERKKQIKKKNDIKRNTEREWRKTKRPPKDS